MGVSQGSPLGSDAHAIWTAIQAAFRDKLPIRVVVCDGEMRDIENDDSDPSRVEKRLLDPIAWAVTAYDWDTGVCTVTRGATADRFVD